MKYINFILLASLMSSFSVRAEEQAFSKEIRVKAEVALAKAKVVKKVASSVAKTFGYAALTSFYTSATILSAGALVPLWYQLSEGYVATPFSEEGGIVLPHRYKFENDEASQASFVTVAWSTALVALAGGMAKLTKDCAVKTKEAAKEIKNA